MDDADGFNVYCSLARLCDVNASFNRVAVQCCGVIPDNILGRIVILLL